MSGAKLCSLLAELGYEGCDSLDPDSFEWPFQHEEARHLLNWICSSLRPTNVLSPAEVSQYELFLKEGKLLEGEDLDFAFNSVSAFSNRRNSQEAVIGAEEGIKEIRESTLVYKAEALELQKQLRHLQSQFDLLTSHSSSLIQGRRSRISSSSATNGQLAALEEKISARNLEMNEVLERIASSVKELSSYHSGDEEGIYLTYLDFASYLRGDSACRKELEQWFVKQFEMGPFRLVLEDSKSKCSWVSLDDIANCFTGGDMENPYHHRVTELQRLRSIFGTSERQWVEAQVENAKQQAVLLTLKSQISADEAHIHLDLHSLRRKHSELTGELSTLYMKEQKLLSETIPSLCWELAHLQDTYILQGDYDLKLMRQKYYTGQLKKTIPSLCWELAHLQDTYILQGDYDLKLMRQKYYTGQLKKYIHLLVNLLAKHQFLKLACHFERTTILKVYELLKVVESELDGYIMTTTARVDRCLSLIQIASEANEQGAVDDRDSFLHSVRDILTLYTNSPSVLPTYVSAPGIIHHIKELQSDLMYLQSDLENTLPEDRNGCINDMCTLIQSMQQLLFSSSTTAQPILTSWPLMKEIAEMEKVNSQLSAAVEDVTRTHGLKAEIVKLHPHEVGRDRQIFVDFFTNPDRLRNQVREITARVKALQV